MSSLRRDASDLPLDADAYDMIVMAEVIEHLYIAPTLVLPAFRRCLKAGGILLVTTPNGVALSTQVWMLSGRNPFEMLRENLDNPGHFREYTRPEMLTLGTTAGFSSTLVDRQDVYRSNLPLRIMSWIHGSLRQVLFCTFTK
jgi:2-polyprenyl-3-methyl-5-hydroxy-6-metoxy-1,4-benzoquinol methylase